MGASVPRTITLINGNTVDRDSLDAHEDQLYQDFLEKKRQVCEAERAAEQAQDDQDTCELGLGIARKVLSTASSRTSVAKLTAAREDARSSCAGLDQPPDAYKEVDAQLSKAIAAAQASQGGTTVAGKQTASGNAAQAGKSAAMPANPKYPVAAQAASTLPPRERWMATGSPADCAAASALEKTTAGWHDMCVPDPARGGSAPTAKKLKALKKVPAPIARAGDLANALAKLLQGLPQDTARSGDDGRPCGQWNGYRARGRCFAPWYGNTPQACQTDLGGTYYPASADRPISFCGYDADATPLAAGDFCGKAGGHMDDGICWILGLTHGDCDDLDGQIVASGGNQYCAIGASPAPRTAKDGEACGDAGGHVHGNACWIIGLTRSDCAGLRGKIVESEGYRYCAYDPAAVTQTAGGLGSKPASDNLRDRLRKSLSSGGNAKSDDSSQDASQTAGTPKAPAAPPKQIAQKTTSPAEERKACAALGSKWRYDPTATYNFSPGAPAKCFPIFTESFEGEPGFETKQ
jgi:hypothetical protein